MAKQAVMASLDGEDIHCSHLYTVKLKALDNIISEQVKESIVCGPKSKFLENINQFLQKVGKNIKGRKNEVDGFTEFMTKLRMTDERQRWDTTKQKSSRWPVLIHALWDSILTELRIMSKQSQKRSMPVITLEKLEPCIANNSITKNLFIKNKDEVRKINKSIESESIKLDLEITINSYYKEKLQEFSFPNGNPTQKADDFDLNDFIETKLQPLRNKIDKLTKEVIQLKSDIESKTTTIRHYEDIQDKYTDEKQKLEDMGKTITSNVTKSVKPDLEKMLNKLTALETNYTSMSLTLKGAFYSPIKTPNLLYPQSSSSFISDRPASSTHRIPDENSTFSTNSSAHPQPVENSYSSISNTSSQQSYPRITVDGHNNGAHMNSLDNNFSSADTQSTYWAERSPTTVTGFSSYPLASDESVFPRSSSSHFTPTTSPGNTNEPFFSRRKSTPELPPLMGVKTGSGDIADLVPEDVQSARPYRSPTPRSRSSSAASSQQEKRKGPTD